MKNINKYMESIDRKLAIHIDTIENIEVIVDKEIYDYIVGLLNTIGIDIQVSLLKIILNEDVTNKLKSLTWQISKENGKNEMYFFLLDNRRPSHFIINLKYSFGETMICSYIQDNKEICKNDIRTVKCIINELKRIKDTIANEISVENSELFSDE